MDTRARPGAGEDDALAAHRGRQPAQQVRLHPGPRVADIDDPVGRAVGLRPCGGKQGTVDAVLRHQLRRLGGQGLSLRRGDSGALGLGKQLADTGEQGARRLGIHAEASVSIGCAIGRYRHAVTIAGRRQRVPHRTLPAPPGPAGSAAPRPPCPHARPGPPFTLGPMAVQMAPSILSADFARLASEAEAVSAVADWLHVDVMDNHFVPNLTIGLPVVESLLKHTGLPLDCHLMITDPDRWAPAYAEAGARNVTVHAEAARQPVRLLRMIRSAGARAGLAINPATPVEPYADLLPEIDMLLLMTVEPGFGGQPFLDLV